MFFCQQPVHLFAYENRVNATYLKFNSVVEIISIFCYFRHFCYFKNGNYNTLKSILPNKVEAASTAPL